MLGVVAHYTSEDRLLRHSVLALKEVHGQHSGENQAQAFLEVMDEYQIRNKIVYMMTDNATNNDTMIKEVSRGLKEEDSIDYDPTLHRLRCNVILSI